MKENKMHIVWRTNYFKKKHKLTLFWDRVLHVPVCPETHYVVVNNLELLIPCLHFPKCCYYSQEPSYQVVCIARDQTQWFVHTGQALYQLSHILSYKFTLNVHLLCSQNYYPSHTNFQGLFVCWTAEFQFKVLFEFFII